MNKTLALAEKLFGHSDPDSCVACKRHLDDDPTGIYVCPDCFNAIFSGGHVSDEEYDKYDELLRSLEPNIGDECRQKGCTGHLTLVGTGEDAQFVCDTCRETYY